jgi:thioredoxin reductase (NADPH)
MPKLTGPEMVNQFVRHAKEMGVEIQEGRVLEIIPMGEYYALNVNNEFYEARTVVIATGVPKARQLPGEKELIGKGVSYCATCDGPLYRERTVVVVGETQEAEEDVNYLQEICEKVYYIPTYEDVKNVHSDVEIIKGKPTEILGDDFVTGIRIDDKIVNGDGVFLIKEITPVTQLIKGLELEERTIKVSRFMETNFPGVYAAGDCTGRPFQVAKAIGEGLTASLQAVGYLHMKDSKKND